MDGPVCQTKAGNHKRSTAEKIKFHMPKYKKTRYMLHGT